MPVIPHQASDGYPDPFVGKTRVWRDTDGTSDVVVVDGVGTFEPGVLTIGYTAGTQTLSLTETASGGVVVSAPLVEWVDEYGDRYPNGVDAVTALSTIVGVQAVPDFAQAFTNALNQ